MEADEGAPYGTHPFLVVPPYFCLSTFVRGQRMVLIPVSAAQRSCGTWRQAAVPSLIGESERRYC
jgi:hypothetical protein